MRLTEVFGLSLQEYTDLVDIEKLNAVFESLEKNFKNRLEACNSTWNIDTIELTAASGREEYDTYFEGYTAFFLAPATFNTDQPVKVKLDHLPKINAILKNKVRPNDPCVATYHSAGDEIWIYNVNAVQSTEETLNPGEITTNGVFYFSATGLEVTKPNDEDFYLEHATKPEDPTNATQEWTGVSSARKWQRNKTAGAWGDFKEVGATSGNSIEAPNLGEDFKFAPVAWDDVNKLWKLAEPSEGADGIIVNGDGAEGRVFFSGVVPLPLGVNDDLLTAFVEGEHYFLSQIVNGGFSATPASTGVFQHLIQIVDDKGVLSAVIDISMPEDIDAEAGGETDFSLDCGILGAEYKFAAVHWNQTNQAWELATATTGADGIAVNADTVSGRICVGGVAILPDGIVDDQGASLVKGEYYFLSQSVPGKIQREKPTTGMFQNVLQVTEINGAPAVIIDIDAPQDISSISAGGFYNKTEIDTNHYTKTDIDTAAAVQDGRLDDLEASDVAQDNRLDVLEGLSARLPFPAGTEIGIDYRYGISGIDDQGNIKEPMHIRTALTQGEGVFSNQYGTLCGQMIERKGLYAGKGTENLYYSSLKQFAESLDFPIEPPEKPFNGGYWTNIQWSGDIEINRTVPAGTRVRFRGLYMPYTDDTSLPINSNAGLNCYDDVGYKGKVLDPTEWNKWHEFDWEYTTDHDSTKVRIEDSGYDYQNAEAGHTTSYWCNVMVELDGLQDSPKTTNVRPDYQASYATDLDLRTDTGALIYKFIGEVDTSPWGATAYTVISMGLGDAPQSIRAFVDTAGRDTFNALVTPGINTLIVNFENGSFGSAYLNGTLLHSFSYRAEGAPERELSFNKLGIRTDDYNYSPNNIQVQNLLIRGRVIIGTELAEYSKPMLIDIPLVGETHDIPYAIKRNGYIGNYVCMVNALGTGAPVEIVDPALPATATANQRYVLANPFGINAPVILKAEALINGKWADTGWIYASGTQYGVNASFVQGEGIVVQTGYQYISAYSHDAGGGHGLNSGGGRASAPVRIHVWKL